MSIQEHYNEQTVLAPFALDDSTLVTRAKEGDLHAFESLVRRYEVKLYRLALRICRNKADAEDVVQETFLTAWRRLPEVQDPAAIAGWLYRTATTRSLNALRKRKPTSEFQEEAAPAIETGDPQRHAVAAVQVEALHDALGELTGEQRAVWLLREVHGRSYEEIAQTMCTTPQAVRGRLARARVQLAELMQPWQ